MMRRPQFGRENAYLVTEKSAADVEKSDWPRRRWLSEREAQDLAYVSPRSVGFRVDQFRMVCKALGWKDPLCPQVCRDRG